MRVRSAFALLPLLALSGLCLAVALLCLWTSSLASFSTTVSLRGARLRLDALAAARIGCGELVQALGPDSRWSGCDGSRRAWSARKVEKVWVRKLLSGSCSVPRGGSLVWSVRDLSSGCDLAAPILARERAPAVAQLPRMRQRLASGATLVPTTAALSAARVCDVGGLRTYMPLDLPTSVYVAGARSLLVNPKDGLWRQNLSVPSALAATLGSPLASTLLSSSMDLRLQPARGMEPVESVGEYASLRHMPVITDLALSLGVFNARSDGRHRVRLHAQVTLWNPSALPLLTVSDKRMFLAEIEGAPEVTVTNLDSGASFSTWLDRSPSGVFWSYTQGPRERSLWWWMEVLDATRYGMLRSGILPGEVYSMFMPDPVSQPYGLARVIGKETWRYDEAEHPTGWVRPSPETFLPSDRIVVAMRFITPGTTVRLHPYVGPLDAMTEASAYGSPALLAIRHIPWPDARLELSGAEYSRVDSNGYVVGERRFCWRARLAAETDEDVYALARGVVGMGQTIDLADPVRRQGWVLTADAVAEAQQSPSDFLGRPQSPLQDLVVNRHDASMAGSFTDWRVRDVPVDPPLDVPSLRALHGMPTERWLAQVDRAFFACPETNVQSGLSENPRLAPWRRAWDVESVTRLSESLAGPDAAQSVSLEGAFNVNTQDAYAWEAFLRSVPLEWMADTGGPSPPGQMAVEAAFFTQPTGAMLAKFASAVPCDLTDDGLDALSQADCIQASRRQSVRSLKPEKLRQFCVCLADEIARHGDPFVGVEDFLRSGVVEKAILSAGLNEGLPVGSPLTLDAIGLLGAQVALLVARGDTFTVMGEARVGGAFMALELTLQRMPEGAARPHLGRRFVVTKARWLDAPSR